MTKIIHSRLLGGWYVVRGAHHTPLSGRFDSKAEAHTFISIASNRKPVRRET